jgi:hypothetical protein
MFEYGNEFKATGLLSGGNESTEFLFYINFFLALLLMR